MEDAPARSYDPAASADTLATARQNIAKLRQADADLQLIGPDGSPAANVDVEIVQTQHAFPFGEQLCLLDKMVREGTHQTDTALHYKQAFTDALSAANATCYWTERPQNDMAKTETHQGWPRLDGFRHCVDWAASEGLIVKGHPLVWSIPKCTPAWLMRYDLETQMKFLEVRVRQLVGWAAGKVSIWDLVNEALWEPAWKNLPNRHWPHIEPVDDLAEYIAPAIGWARSEDPDATYLVNDYGLCGDRGVEAADGTVVTSAMQRKRFLELAARLDDRGSRPDGLGLQSHVGGWVPHEHQWAVYEELAAAGLPLHVTEFWPPRPDPDMPEDESDALTAEYVGNYLTVAFGHPSIDAFFFWGFLGRTCGHLLGRKGSGWDPKPAYTRVVQLIREEWSTRLRATTDAQGRLRFRGFRGQYALRYGIGAGQTKGVKFRLGDAQGTLPLKLVHPAR